MKIMGPHFLYPINAYPDNPDNEWWPFFRPVRQLLAHGQRLAVRPDVVVQSMGIAGRAFDVPAPKPHPPIAAPVVTGAEAARLWAASHAQFPHAYCRVFATAAEAGPLEAALPAPAVRHRRVGRWVLLTIADVPPEEAAELAAFEAMRQSATPSPHAPMMMHYVARVCCTSEATACAAAPPPGGTTAYRDWRDSLCGAVVEKALRGLTDAILLRTEAGAPSSVCEKAMSACERALVAATSWQVVGRRMTHSEAAAILDTAACAASVAACMDADASPADKQHTLDVVDAVMGLDIASPSAMRPASPHLAAFCAVHDALTAAMMNDPIDAHPSPSIISTPDNRPIVASRPSGEARPPANRMRWQALDRLRASAAAGAPADFVFATRQSVLDAAEFVPRPFALAVRPETPADEAVATPSMPALMPQYVAAFPPFTTVYPGTRPIRDLAMTVTLSAGTMRAPASASGEVYEVAPPESVRATLPFGTQVVASYWAQGVDVRGAGRVRLRIDNAGGKLRTLACVQVPEQQSEAVLAMSFGKSGAHARLQLVDGRADVMYVFLPPSKVV